MENDGQMIEDVQLWALEHDRNGRSRAANAAGAALAEYHRDLPEIVGQSSRLLSNLGIDAGTSRTASRRIADSATRELIGGGKEAYEPHERQDILRRALRDVLIQEAAGHELARRSGIDPVRTLDRDPDHGQGARATVTLRRQGVDVDGLFGHMTEHDLAKTSHGAYNRVSLLAHPKLVKALETGEQTMTAEQIAMNTQINGAMERSQGAEGRGLPGERIKLQSQRRWQAPAPQRQPTFGRRMAQVQAHAMAGAGM